MNRCQLQRELCELNIHLNVPVMEISNKEEQCAASSNFLLRNIEVGTFEA